MQVVRYAAGDWGVGELWFDGDGLPVWHELPTRTRELRPAGTAPGKGDAGPPTITLAGPRARVRTGSVPEVARRIAAYFEGDRVSFEDVAVDLEWCTPLQRAIAGALRTVPYGETVSYGELAALAGRPQAPRAGGAFCSQNRLPLIFPCHRVVAAGGIGGYGSLGVEYKRRLLELEGAAL
ncbi:MAG TPA: methylated-DNA--[protein]-cysteine S-methyltransferase [Gaiellaceae bacterium]|nr:methylated-DNA--[protein]-cysteine S-methyltransferase [Gaiellaceae bacterium]